jgi:hypothetical protein
VQVGVLEDHGAGSGQQFPVTLLTLGAWVCLGPGLRDINIIRIPNVKSTCVSSYRDVAGVIRLMRIIRSIVLCLPGIPMDARVSDTSTCMQLMTSSMCATIDTETAVWSTSAYIANRFHIA